MDIICIIEIIDNSKGNASRFFLGILAVLSIVVGIAGLLAGTKVTLLLFFLLLYIIPAYIRRSNNTYFGDVPVHLEKMDDEMLISTPNVILEKDGRYGREYSFGRETLSVRYNADNNTAYVHGSGTISITQNGEPLSTYEFENEVITLKAGETDYFRLKSFLDGLI